MKRSGFTMIELIFVIVILGILTSIVLGPSSKKGVINNQTQQSSQQKTECGN